MEGYHHPLYAKSFSNIGTPIYLQKSKGWLIKRNIPGTKYFDAMGTYPLFFCEDWDQIIDDINSLSNDLVAVSLVIGPLENIPIESFFNFFNVFFEYRYHYILDTSIPTEEVISVGRRRDALKALKGVEVETIISPNIDLDEWCQLYENLIQKHQISGIRSFSRESFQKQLLIPDTHYVRVVNQGDVVGGALFYIQGNTAYYHLAAQKSKGYDLHSGYAAIWTAVQALSKKVRWIEFQGGSTVNGLDGLSEFKKGWSSSRKKSYFCGKVLDVQKYDEVLRMKRAPETDWFPAYRSSDFNQK